MPLNPRDDPANRYEALEAFERLLPPAHLFAEWPMPDTKQAPPHQLTASGNVVTDSVTKLRWQWKLPATYPGCTGRYKLAMTVHEEGSGCSWEQAQAYCATAELAQSLGGGTWRLPTRVELESLLGLSRWPTIPPMLESDRDDFYWTSSPAPNPEGVKLAWCLDFMDGYTYVTWRFNPGRVRCVSSDADTGGREPSYDLDEQRVVDWNTYLTWQRVADDATRTWEEARSYCETLNLDNERWRLPSLKELVTIVDTRRHQPAIDPHAFPQTREDRFWTDQSFIGDAEQAYVVEFIKGETGYYPKTYKHYVRCVR